MKGHEGSKVVMEILTSTAVVTSWQFLRCGIVKGAKNFKLNHTPLQWQIYTYNFLEMSVSESKGTSRHGLKIKYSLLEVGFYLCIWVLYFSPLIMRMFKFSQIERLESWALMSLLPTSRFMDNWLHFLPTHPPIWFILKYISVYPFILKILQWVSLRQKELL